MKTIVACLSLAVFAALFLTEAAVAAESAEVPAPDAVKAKAKAMMERGIAWLLEQQKENGSFAAEQMEPAVTALALRAMATSPMRDELMKTDAFKKALDFVLSCVKPDGGIYLDVWAGNYHTSIALSGLASIQDPELRPTIDKALAYVKEAQADEAERVSPGDPSYGGFGYRKGQREGDMSNLQFALMAFKDSGLSSDDAAWGKALEFVQKCQNLTTDGGFIYRPNESKAGEDAETSTDTETYYRSYQSMTYVGLLSMIYCDVTKDDARVQRAVEWIKQHWGFDENYPLGLQGLFYNFQTLSRALAAYGDKTITDADGVAHDWYAELVEALAARQNKDGSWVNTEKRWFEDDRTLVTAYCLLALAQPYEQYK